MKVNVFRYDAQKAESAFMAHKALIRAEQANPSLKDNPDWTLLRLEAFERFSEAFERV
jgi:hypothetical protein